MRKIFGLVCACLLLATPAFADEAYSWTSTGPIVYMGSVKDKICFLAGIHGRFSGGGESVSVQNINGLWVLWGHGVNSVNADARCVKNADLGKPGDVHWVSDAFFIDNVKGCTPKKANAWWGDAMTAVMTVGGRLRGQGEFVSVEQASDGKTPSRLVVQSCQSGAVAQGGAYSFFVGKAQSGVGARFIGPNGVGTAAQAGEYVVGNNSSIFMAPDEDAVCYLTRVSGGFYGDQDGIQLVHGSDAQKVSHWVLRTSSTQGDGVYARARCYLVQP